MSEEIYLQYKFKNRKTGDFKEGYIKIPDVAKYANGFKRMFDIHEFKICEKRLVSKEEFDKKGKA
jgi:hypothetical protein